MTHDKQGRAYAQFSKLKPGDVIEADGDFTCLNKGERCPVKSDDAGLYVCCRDDSGQHYLDGQADGDAIIGFYRCEPAP